MDRRGARFRVQTSAGALVLDHPDADPTLQELRQLISERTSIPARKLQLLSGFPPKELKGDANQKLSQLSVFSGDAIIVREVEVTVDSEEEPPLMPADGTMQLVEVPGDNSCLFTALGYVLGGRKQKDGAMEMRKLIAGKVSADPAQYNEVFLGKSNGEYCEFILDPDHWGGAIELAIFSQHYNVEIASIDIQTLRPLIYGEERGLKRRVFIIYNGVHYDALIASDGQTVFRSDDDTPITQAIVVADQLKADGKFLDLKRFKLRCAVCNCALVGEQEARQHAAQTGHTHFTEYK